MFAVFSANPRGSNPTEGLKPGYDSVDDAAASVFVLTDECGLVLGDSFLVGRSTEIVNIFRNCIQRIRELPLSQPTDTEFVFALATGPLKTDITVTPSAAHPTLLETHMGVVVGSDFFNHGDQSITAFALRQIEVFQEVLFK